MSQMNGSAAIASGSTDAARGGSALLCLVGVAAPDRPMDMLVLGRLRVGIRLPLQLLAAIASGSTNTARGGSALLYLVGVAAPDRPMDTLALGRLGVGIRLPLQPGVGICHVGCLVPGRLAWTPCTWSRTDLLPAGKVRGGGGERERESGRERGVCQYRMD